MRNQDGSALFYSAMMWRRPENTVKIRAALVCKMADKAAWVGCVVSVRQGQGGECVLDRNSDQLMAGIAGEKSWGNNE